MMGMAVLAAVEEEEAFESGIVPCWHMNLAVAGKLRLFAVRPGMAPDLALDMAADENWLV